MTVLDLMTVLSFGLTCFAIGYTIGSNRATKNLLTFVNLQSRKISEKFKTHRGFLLCGFIHFRQGRLIY